MHAFPSKWRQAIIPKPQSAIALTFDVEDWFQSTIDRTASIRNIVVAQIEKTLSILEENDTHATFFVLGLVADKFPRLIQKIASLGHEVASHGYGHESVSALTPSEFAQDLERSIKVLEDLTGKPILGYRAPFFSISEKLSWAFDILCQHGIHYDSSLFLIGNNRYRIRYKAHIHKIPTNYRALIEFPPSTVRFGKISFPTGGGGYFRVLQYPIIRWAIRKSIAKNLPAMIYMHTFEFDDEDLAEPLDLTLRCLDSSIRMKFLRYNQQLNRSKSESKLRRLLQDFNFVPARACVRSIDG